MSNNWLHIIRTQQVTPPEGAWVNIANALDKEDNNSEAVLKNKLLEFETTPPAMALANIFVALDKAEGITSFSERINNYSVKPPANTWNKIEQRLDATEAKIIPLQRNRKAIYYKLAAAASVIAIITTVFFGLNKSNDNTNNNIATITPKVEDNSIIITPEPKVDNTITPTSETKEKKLVKKAIAALPEKNLTNPEPANFYVPAYVKGNAPIELAQLPKVEFTQMLQDVNEQTPMDIALMNAPNSYISITGPDGQSVKLSSKFSNLINLLNDKNPAAVENIDIIISESAKWRSTFANWREKMTNNSVAPSISNFMDIIELSKMLEAKK